MNGGLCSSPADFSMYTCDCSQIVWSGTNCAGTYICVHSTHIGMWCHTVVGSVLETKIL